MALLVDGGRLVGTIERADLVTSIDEAPAREVATLDGRTIGPAAALSDALAVMEGAGRRRLAVTTDDSALLGLLCLKASGHGFCSDEDVEDRRHDRDSEG